MMLYKEEKKRIGSLRWGIVCIVLFLFMLSLQTQMLHIREMEKLGEPLKPIIYKPGVLFWGVIVLVCYLNSKMFYVKERGKNVYLLEKYRITPVSIKRMYQVKLRIMLETVFVLIFFTIPVYFFVLVANKHFMIEPGLVNGIAGIAVFAVVFLGTLVLVVDAVHEFH